MPLTSGPSLQDAASFDYPVEDDESLRPLSSITSLSSASSRLHEIIFPRPPTLFVPNSANPLERDLLHGQTTTCGSNNSVSLQDQHPAPNHMVRTSIFLVSMADSHRALGTQTNRTPTSPTSSNLSPTPRRRDLPSAEQTHLSAVRSGRL
jgi:hypothetical protein